LNNHFKIGVGGFSDYQLLEDKMEGERVRNSREIAIGGGPLFIGSFKKYFFDIGIFFDGIVKNRPNGWKITFIIYRIFSPI
jgi:hypothetical protein